MQEVAGLAHPMGRGVWAPSPPCPQPYCRTLPQLQRESFSSARYPIQGAAFCPPTSAKAGLTRASGGIARPCPSRSRREPTNSSIKAYFYHLYCHQPSVMSSCSTCLAEGSCTASTPPSPSPSSLRTVARPCPNSRSATDASSSPAAPSTSSGTTGASPSPCKRPTWQLKG